jgi:hypothetical protein
VKTIAYVQRPQDTDDLKTKIAAVSGGGDNRETLGEIDKRSSLRKKYMQGNNNILWKAFKKLSYQTNQKAN